MVTEEKEITLDMSQMLLPSYLTKGKGKKRRTRKSYPGEAVYQRRKKWWEAHDYGEDAAKWAAGWRLGLPKKKGKMRDWEVTAIDRAIKLADKRVAEVNYRMETFKESKGKAIKHLDEELRLKDKAEKVNRGLVEPDISIYHKKIQPNIYKALS